MPLGYATGEIAGVQLVDSNSTPCKALILDGVNTQITATASVQFSADGEVHTQAFETSKGQAFGVRIEFLPPDKLSAIIAAVMAAVAAGEPFNVTLSDDIQSINADCTLDFSQTAISFPEQRTNEKTVKGLVLRFLTI